QFGLPSCPRVSFRVLLVPRMRDTSVTRLGASVLRNREPTGVIAVVSSHEVHDDWPASYAGSRAGRRGTGSTRKPSAWRTGSTGEVTAAYKSPAGHIGQTDQVQRLKFSGG